VPIPWQVAGPDHGFGAGGPPWLPPPEGWGEWSVEAQTGRTGSTLELYRTALRLRREHVVPAGLAAELVDAGPDVVAVRRGDLLCVTNLGSARWPPPAGARLLVSSEDPVGGPDTTSWWELP
jgi:alpha-glucosidase